MKKRCTGCQRNLPLTDFRKNRSFPDGHAYRCRACSAAAEKAYRSRNRVKIGDHQKKYREANKARNAEKSRAYQKAYYEANKSRISTARKAYYAANKSRISDRTRERLKDPEVRARNKQRRQRWFKTARGRELYYAALKRYRNSPKGKAATKRVTQSEKHKVRIRVWSRQYRQQPARHLHHNTTVAVGRHLRHRGSAKEGRALEELLGYSIAELMRHLEALFLPGMSWDNYGRWHVDHKRPMASFEFKSADDPGFHACWALNNLQPLWACDNQRKNAKVS